MTTLDEREGEEYPKYYFAYGSDIDNADFLDFCNKEHSKNVKMKLIGPAVAVDYVMKFHCYSETKSCGTADIIPTKNRGFAVPGLIYKVSRSAWKALDIKNGHPYFYKRTYLNKIALTSQEKLDDVATYCVVSDRITDHFVAPSKDYIDVIRRSLQQHLLDTTMLDVVSVGFKFDPEVNISKVFVYGTLREGEGRDELMRVHNLDTVHRNVTVQGTLHHIKDYPALTYSPDKKNQVIGELYEYKGSVSNLLKVLDEVEGYVSDPNISNKRCLYRRVITKVSLSQNKWCSAWTYVYNFELSKTNELIESGDWVLYRKKYLN